MNINVVLHETDFVIQNTNSVQRVKQLAEVFTAYAEELEQLPEKELCALAHLFMQQAAEVTLGRDPDSGPGKGATSAAAALDEDARQLPCFVQQTLQIFLDVTGGGDGKEGGSPHAVWQSAWQGWQMALTPLRSVSSSGAAADFEPDASLRRLHGMGSVRIMAVLTVTSALAERAGQPPAGVQLGSAAIINLLIYLQVFQGLRGGDLLDSLRASVTPALPDNCAEEFAAADEPAEATCLIFQHLVASLQAHSFEEMCTGSNHVGPLALASTCNMKSEATKAAIKRAQNVCSVFLISWRRASPPTWDACTAALLESLVAALAKGTRSAEAVLQSEPGSARICALLASPRASAALATTLVCLPSVQEKQGPRLALDIFAACYGADLPSVLAGASQLLPITSNMPLEIRIEACSAMQRAADQWLDAHEDEVDEPSAERLWSDAAVNALLDTLSQDASLRVRRAAMRLVSTVAVRNGSDLAQRLVHTIAQKCRDKDSQIREMALQLLVQFPPAELRACLSVEEWQSIFDVALDPGDIRGLDGAHKDAEEQLSGIFPGDCAEDTDALSDIQHLGKQLLRSYLHLENATAATPENIKEAEPVRISMVSSIATAAPSAVPRFPVLAAAIEDLDIHSERLPGGLFAAYRNVLRQLMKTNAAAPVTAIAVP